MSTMPGGNGITARFNCMIVSGFPGIGKTSTYNEMKRDFIGAKVVDMDVKNYGTTNGIDVEDPAAYVRELVEHTKTNACVFVTCDPNVRLRMREAGLFYIIVAPEFPQAMNDAMKSMVPNFRPDALIHGRYMTRFVDNLGYNSLAAQTLDGKGYEDAVADCFDDPMPHIVSEVFNKQVYDQIMYQLENQTRTCLAPNALTQMPGAPSSFPGAPQMPGPGRFNM